MSENDFSAAYPPELPEGRESERPAAHLQQDGSSVATPPAPTAPKTPAAGSERIDAPRFSQGTGPGTERPRIGGMGGEPAPGQATRPQREAGQHASGVLDKLGRGMHENAAVGERKAAANLQRIRDDLAWMVKDKPAGGVASALVEEAARTSESLADWLDERVLFGRLAGHRSADGSAGADTTRTGTIRVPVLATAPGTMMGPGTLQNPEPRGASGFAEAVVRHTSMFEVLTKEPR